MTYDYKAKKVVAVLSSDLEMGVALNVLGHMAISIGAYGQDLMGRPCLLDASACSHLGVAKYPFIITKLKASKLKTLVQQVRREKNILIADYPEEVLTTAHDDELASAIASISEESIKYLGAILYGDAEAINKLTSKFSLWR